MLYPVLGIPHPAINTRDVALYQPFRNTLRQPNATLGLQTLVWQFMRRRVGEGPQNPVGDDHRCIRSQDVAKNVFPDRKRSGYCRLVPLSVNRLGSEHHSWYVSLIWSVSCLTLKAIRQGNGRVPYLQVPFHGATHSHFRVKGIVSWLSRRLILQ
jgi:hypothetical protein